MSAPGDWERCDTGPWQEHGWGAVLFSCFPGRGLFLFFPQCSNANRFSNNTRRFPRRLSFVCAKETPFLSIGRSNFSKTRRILQTSPLLWQRFLRRLKKAETCEWGRLKSPWDNSARHFSVSFFVRRDFSEKAKTYPSISPKNFLEGRPLFPREFSKPRKGLSERLQKVIIFDVFPIHKILSDGFV